MNGCMDLALDLVAEARAEEAAAAQQADAEASAS